MNLVSIEHNIDIFGVHIHVSCYCSLDKVLAFTNHMADEIRELKARDEAMSEEILSLK